MRALVSNTGLFNNSEQAEVTATICYEVIVLGETRGDRCCTQQQERFQLRKKRKIDAVSRIKQGPPQPPDTRLQL